MQISSIAKLFAVLLIASQLTACGVLAVGGVAATATIAADRRTPAVQAIDKGIELEAGNALSKRFGDSAHINVTSFNQKVLLTGEVKDADIKGEAGAYVKAMKNARSVFNELIIGPNSSFTARANDSYLESKIKTQMVFTDKLPSNSMAIVAEGLETVEQVEAVRMAGCTLGQGYYFSRAVPDYLAAMLIAQERETQEPQRATG